VKLVKAAFGLTPMSHLAKYFMVLHGAAFIAWGTVAIARADPFIDLKPQIFAPGVISGPAHDSAPAFTPNGKTIFFGRSSSAAAFILVSERIAQGWSEPKIAPFSGRWLDMEPAMAPDGTYLIFASNRPAVPAAHSVDGEMNGTLQPEEGSVRLSQRQ
jgi:WD40-like Beta Propeller Repeat